jgi:DNA mismatch repair protein MutS
MSDSNLTPMMRQYRAAKAESPKDSILLFRLGDFYEMFFEDAVQASKLLDITLTNRQGYPMSGFPWHALDTHLPRLIAAGVKIAIAEQMEDPREAKGIVKREITRIITPGTVIDAVALNPECNNFLIALVIRKERYGLASLDISTGEFRVTEIESAAAVETEMNRLNARECLIAESLLDEWDGKQTKPQEFVRKMLWTPLPDWVFSTENSTDVLKRQFKTATLDGFGCRELPLAVCAAGAVLYYAIENLKHPAGHIRRLQSYHNGDYMTLDSISQRNLELVEPMFGNRESTLLYVLNQTNTPMGGRLMREWILRPLFNRVQINDRLDAVEALKDDPLTLAETLEVIGTVRDLERIIGRLNIGSANARDLVALANSLAIVPAIRLLLDNFQTRLLDELKIRLEPLPEPVDKIRSAIVDEPPQGITEGDIIREGYSAELDELRRWAREGKNCLSEIQAREQERSGIRSLKVRYNKVFGYYIEISKSNLSMVPEDYIRKQTLVNAERFITPELKELESKILGAEEKSKALEHELFQQLRESTLEYTARIQDIAAAIARVDVIGALAECARRYGYVRPKVTDSNRLHIFGGRHPVLDAAMRNERFVPNDVLLDGEENRMMIITGPNMAGKSTYIRQTALLVLMAQMGSFIPAESAEIGLVDRIFTRVGAADDIARGQSTFMVEMVETANILNHATDRSLVILDEIGRGTSTFDGLSIAWAVAEFLHDAPGSRARTQFATHYHELTELALSKKGVKNYNVAVKEYGDQIIFLRQIVPGGTDKSYGIHVAKLAGLPQSVIERSNEILENLENSALSRKTGKPLLAEKRHRRQDRICEKRGEYKTDNEPEQIQPTLF